tara:strand:+ start:895 stop:1281 length:387 start_codon:yes stop_codon:yes gene_type:complete
MFGIINIVKYLTFISYIGLFISSISGFIDVSNNEFDLCKLMISLLVFINIPVVLFVEYSNKDVDVEPVIHYSRSYCQIIMSLLVIGISPVGIGFGIYGVVISVSNLMLGIFNCTDILDNPVMPIQVQE